MQIGQHVFANYDANLQEQTKLENLKSLEKNQHIPSKSEINALKEGTVFRAQILEMIGDKVKLALTDHSQLLARLDKGISLGIGDQLLFSVKENGTNQILIKPMFESLYTTKTQVLEKALVNAQLSFTEKNFAIAKELMDAGMPVDKNNLVKVLSQSLKYEGSSLNTLVHLNKMQVPVTSESIHQFENYKSHNHQISNCIGKMSQQISTIFQSFPADVTGKELLHTANQLLEIFSTQGNENKMNQDGTNDFVKPSTVNPEFSLEPQMVHANEKFQSSSAFVQDYTDFKTSMEGKIQEKNEFNTQIEHVENRNFERNKINHLDYDTQASKLVISKDVLYHITKRFHDEGMSKEVLNHIWNNSTTAEEFLKESLNKLSDLDLKDHVLKRILHSKEFSDVLEEIINKNWAIQPKSMKDAKEIENLYNKIIQQGNEIQELIANKGGDFKEFSQNFQGMKQNMQFIEQLNQQMAYAQIPLKLSEQNTNSELFVYADKRKLMEKKDEISVMLHLDMDHLGMTDIKVALTGNQVHARFYLNDQVSVELVKQHMGDLEKQLLDRGFSLSNEVVKRKDQDSSNRVLDEIIDDDVEKSIKRYTFDART